MAGGAVGVRCLHIAGMTGGAGAAVGRDTRLQGRYRRMTEVAVSTVGNIDRCILGAARNVTIVAWACQRHVTGRDMIDTAVCRRISRMAIQAVGWIGAGRDGGDDFSPGAVVTGFTGARPVGGDVVLGAVDLAPGRHDVTAATGCSAGQVFGPQCNSMAVTIMDRIPGGGMAASAVTGSRLAIGQADQTTSRGVVAAGASIVGLGRGADQGVVVTAGAAGTCDGDDT